MHIHIINGPNLNLLGKREVDIYGNQDFESYLKHLQQKFSTIKITYYQSNVEGELINEIQHVGFGVDGIVFNPAGYSHTSIAIADAIAAITSPVVEVHISNIYAREEYRKHSFISANAKGVITGLGL
ncbi:MAG: 3-dehydroquinate dehydratase, partial [Bacteroidetes bacterium]|nr:3-dehydroquinate dehydratase [Bacteroidota bacterium]